MAMNDQVAGSGTTFEPLAREVFPPGVLDIKFTPALSNWLMKKGCEPGVPTPAYVNTTLNGPAVDGLAAEV